MAMTRVFEMRSSKSSKYKVWFCRVSLVLLSSWPLSKKFLRNIFEVKLSLFLLVLYWLQHINILYENCWWLDLYLGPRVSKASTLQTVARHHCPSKLNFQCCVTLKVMDVSRWSIWKILFYLQEKSTLHKIILREILSTEYNSQVQKRFGHSRWKKLSNLSIKLIWWYLNLSCHR